MSAPSRSVVSLKTGRPPRLDLGTEIIKERFGVQLMGFVPRHIVAFRNLHEGRKSKTPFSGILVNSFGHDDPSRLPHSLYH